MADPNTLEGSLANIPGLTEYLAMRRYMGDQTQREQGQAQQQQFLQERANLGPNPTQEQLMGVASRYADPTTLLHYGQASLDRKEAIAARLQQSHELAQYRIDNLQRQRESDLNRVKSDEAKMALDTWYKGEITKHKQFQDEASNELKKLGLGIQQQRADTAQQAVDQRGSQQDLPLLNVLDKIDATSRMIQRNPEAVGGRGILGRGAEFIQGMVSPGAETPASDLQTQILDLQKSYRGLPGHAAGRLKIDAAKIDSLIKGLGTFTSPDQALNSLNVLRETISRQLQRQGGAQEPNYPTATNPQTGEKLIFKDGQWQTP
jgi:hypothetical protein